MVKGSSKKKQSCVHCGKATSRVHPILQDPLCQLCQRKFADKYQYISKSRALQEYRLKPDDLGDLKCHEVDNPHYKMAAPMQLYLLDQIQEVSSRKWGDPSHNVKPHEINEIVVATGGAIPPDEPSGPLQ